VRSETDKPLPKPFKMAPDVRQGLEGILRSQQLFAVQGKGLSVITCRKGPGEYTVGLANNTWSEQPFRLESLCGKIASLRELPLDTSEAGAPGQTPEVVDGSKLGKNTTDTIAGGDVRVFAVKVQEAGVEEIKHQAPPPRPRGRLLPLRRITSIKEELLARPTFFEHFDGVCLDWSYLHEREKEALQRQHPWLQRQGVSIVVDLSSGVDLYPTLRLMDNLHEDYTNSMAAIKEVLGKMEALGAKDLILSLHRYPENNFTDEQSRAAFTATLKALAAQAAERGVTLHLRVGFGKPPSNLAEGFEWLDRAGAPNVKLAVSTALLKQMPTAADTVSRLKDKLGLWLVAASAKDVADKMWDEHVPIASARSTESLERLLALSSGTPALLDALYANQDEEYLDAMTLTKAFNQVAR
jgi:hypothetical protein